jgi:ferredoxin-type protein NapH
MSLKSRARTLQRGKWRYLSLFAGFFLIVAPFALIPDAFYYLTGSTLDASIHTICYRVPLAWLSGAAPFLVDMMAATILILIIIGLALIFGPLFCGWICPVGGVSEAISRAVPIPNKYRLQMKDTRVTAGLRYGFFIGYLLVAFAIGQKAITYQFGGVTCRYCASYLLEVGSTFLFKGTLLIEPWHAGVIVALVSWLVIGGLFMVGGRGWCLFFCPLGAISGLSHKAGASLGFYKIDYQRSNCTNCRKCQVTCPMWAIKEDRTIERTLCIGCGECRRSCISKCYTYKKGREKNGNKE